MQVGVKPEYHTSMIADIFLIDNLPNIVTWILFGATAGLLANFINPVKTTGGYTSAVILGILGALTGGVASNTLLGLGEEGIDIFSFIISATSSLILVLIYKNLIKEEEFTKTKLSKDN